MLIDTEKIVEVVTDNARNMLNVISELDLFNFPCIGHTLQLGVKKAFDVPKVHTTLARVRKLMNSFDLRCEDVTYIYIYIYIIYTAK